MYLLLEFMDTERFQQKCIINSFFLFTHIYSGHCRGWGDGEWRERGRIEDCFYMCGYANSRLWFGILGFAFLEGVSSTSTSSAPRSSCNQTCSPAELVGRDMIITPYLSLHQCPTEGSLGLPLPGKWHNHLLIGRGRLSLNALYILQKFWSIPPLSFKCCWSIVLWP